MQRVFVSLLSGIIVVLGLATAAGADDAPASFDLTLKDHRWNPAEIHVPAGKRLTLQIRNLDSTAEEFDSGELGIEKLVTGGGEGTVKIRPLRPGKYAFSGEYHADTARGVLVAE